ncbi:MAG: hypothetical protein M3Q98_01380 [Actinomycetota bacterium]|nr:hypothetical protein [Actinomycetota bacterium]
MLTDSSMTTIGILLLALVTVESGGVFMARVVTGGQPANKLQTNFFRAGHAHAGVLLILGMVIQIPLSQVDTSGVVGWIAVGGVPFAAILMPAGFFLSVLGKDPAKPGRLVALLWAGAVMLTLGLLSAGVLVLRAGVTG